MKQTCFIVAVSLASLVLHAETTYYVSAETGSDDNDGLSWENATASIQHAIDLSHAGDRIIVTNGTYGRFDVASKGLQIESVNGPNQTIIDGNSAGRCVNSASTSATIIGFTIQNGYCIGGSGYSTSNLDGGAGVRNVTAVDCVISNNVGLESSYGSGGNEGYTFWAVGGGARGCILKNCVLARNRAGIGGGAAYCVLDNCIVEDNVAKRIGQGGGSGMYQGSATNCIFRNNGNTTDGAEGGGASSATLHSCLLVNNMAWRGASAASLCSLYNCTLVDNIALDSHSFNTVFTTPHSLSSTDGANGCILVELTDYVDALSGDYHFVPPSPSIDAGSEDYVYSESDLDGNPRISRRGVDVGCYEYPIPIAPEFSAEGGFRFMSDEKDFTIVSDNTNGVLYYAINDGDFVNANAQSIELSTTETIHVRAYVLAYDRFQSEIVEADIVKVEPCSIVEGVTATWNEAETEVAVEWTTQPEAFTYAVYRNTSDDFATATQLANGLTVCSFADAPDNPDVPYYYWVVGENELGPGQVGDAAATRWAQIATPTISPEDGTRFGTATKKVMFACATAGVKFHYTIDGSEPTTNSPSASAFTLRDTATVKVIAVKSRMRDSEVASATITRVLVAAAPALGAVAQVGNGLRVAWGAVDDAESYEVFRGRSPDFAAARSLGETEETEWTDATAEAGVPYYYFVVSKNIAGTSDSGEPALGATLTLATAVNAPQLVFATGANYPWTAVATNGAADGAHQATSGTPDDSAESWLETSVTGPGRITFQWKASCEKDDTGECEWDHLAFRVDGADRLRLDGKTKWTEVSLAIAGGNHVLRWVYAKDEGMSEGDDCGALDCVQWIPDETKGDWEKWVDYYGLLTESGYEALKTKPSGKGDALYGEFVAGLNPIDPLSRFLARIDVTGSAPVISWNPDLGDTRIYTVEGKNTLTNETWNAPNADSRFFRVRVKKEDE